ncbi:type I polyketide synthase [Paenibacillus macquariensis]|uniref:Polyketide synthase PksL/surfactin family lipopeptide synthetase A n=1 Tax=Paenibacillus macquariensis TaxID=948756 RepID=A0ABY1K2J6_9BACL|nr:type I polyketide synthase [Paenibacillus macquariensis]MEC0090201.1 SDR family NAD(P)-dependent oxidoreductase [Paenibacillus macquariensis]OAB39574.1 alcohol dehydrogenase [Paenibacillus macquariensis subsp. macquariensis]SIR17271.1 polyketide synthase PksL/surfactin family lipopeptide synthetase A [Paenibacillus macquariensis]
MKLVQNYLLAQVAAKNLSKMDALPMIKELFENQSKTIKVDDIAIIGMSCRFPGANGTDEFWKNMANEVDSIRDFPENRKQDVDRPIRDYFKGKRHAPDLNYRRGAYLDRVDLFDAQFFNITPVEARCMDPLQRIFLEVTWEAIENAGYSEKELYGSRTGVYVGDTDADYLKLIQEMEPYALPGNTLSVIASRIAYMLNLSSGSHLIDTACSASLAAVHHAIKGLITGDCEMAIAGGLNLTLFPIDEGLADIGIASPDSVARTFDAAANGTVWGEGCGVIILKTLEKAKKDGDYIHAVIKGSSMNSDGRSNGITAPSALAQTELIKEAWRNAGVPPHTVTYFEAHGTGTRLGDPIEIEGISNAFRSYTDERQFCALGAVKTNIGHLDTAAGIAGLIKSVLLLKHKQIPATLHFNEPNPHIAFIDSPVYVNTELIPWETMEDTPRRAGVSAFGIAGTNCHVILEEYEDVGISRSQKELEPVPHLFTLSAKSKESFIQLVDCYRTYLAETDSSFTDICFTSNYGRGHYTYRLAIIVTSLEELQAKLDIFGSTSEAGRDKLKEQGIYYTFLSKRVEKRTVADSDYSVNTVVKEYMLGSEINWEYLYTADQRRRVPLPFYPFSGKRHWFDYVPEQEAVQATIRVQASSQAIDNWFYQMQWVRKPLEPVEQSQTVEGPWLILADDEGIAAAMNDRASTLGKDSILVEAADGFAKVSAFRYRINPASPEDYLTLVAELADCDSLRHLRGIIHLWTCTDIRSSLRSLQDLHASQEKGVLSLFHLLHALKVYEVQQSLDIKIVSNYANLVNKDDTYIFPEKASLWGMMKVAAQEFAEYRFSSIDIETIGRTAEESASEVMRELAPGQHAGDQVVAWRSDVRYTQQLERVELSKLPRKEIKVREEGVYLIAGGVGVVGMETCKYLARRVGVTFVIIHRLPLPSREQWDEVLRNNDNPQAGERIRNLLALEELGSKVCYYAADITDEVAMRKVMNDVKDRFGQVHGVINATMHLEEGRIEQQDRTAILRNMESKIAGTWVLNEVTKDQQLDFVLLFSSFASVLGGAGLSGYAAANAFMDQYVHYQSRRGIEMTAINWSFFEMGATSNQMSDHELSFPISRDEYGLLLDRVFKYQMTQVAIANIRIERLVQALSLLNIQFSSSLTQEWIEPVSSRFDDAPSGQILESYQELKRVMQSNEAIHDSLQRNIELGAKFVAFEELLYATLEPHKEIAESNIRKQFELKVTLHGAEGDSPTERILGQIWGEVLGLEHIDVHTDFFESGDSLMLMSVVTKINERLSVDLPINIFFQEPTVHGLSRWIDEAKGTVFEETDDMDDIPLLPRHFG